MRLRIATVLGVWAAGLSALAAAAPDAGRVREAVLASDPGRALQAVLESEEGAAAVIADAIDAGLPGWAEMNDARAAETIGLLLGVEVRNLRAAREQVEAIARLRKRNALAAVVDEHVMQPAAYGAEDGDPDPIRAARWIHHASNTVGDDPEQIAMVARILEESVRVNDVRRVEDLAALNRVLVDRRDAPTYRPIALAGGKLPSSTGGRHLLALMLANIERKDRGRNLGAYLLGAIVRCHAFADGNGRTARAAYAISILQAGKRFRAPTAAGENELHGLDD